MKIYWFLFLSFCFFPYVYAADPQPFSDGTYVYEFNLSADEIQISGKDSFRTYGDAAKYLEELYNVTLETQEIELVDSKNNRIILLSVNIVTDKSYIEIFEGPAHRSIMIEEITLNMLQPYCLHQEWDFKALVLKLNGVFTEMFDSDRTYPSLVRRKDLLDGLYQMHRRVRYFTITETAATSRGYSIWPVTREVIRAFYYPDHPEMAEEIIKSSAYNELVIIIRELNNLGIGTEYIPRNQETIQVPTLREFQELILPAGRK